LNFGHAGLTRAGAAGRRSRTRSSADHPLRPLRAHLVIHFRAASLGARPQPAYDRFVDISND